MRILSVEFILEYELNLNGVSMNQIQRMVLLLCLCVAGSLMSKELSLTGRGDVSLYKTAKTTQAYAIAKGESSVSAAQSYLVCGVFGC